MKKTIAIIFALTASLAFAVGGGWGGSGGARGGAGESASFNGNKKIDGGLEIDGGLLVRGYTQLDGGLLVEGLAHFVGQVTFGAQVDGGNLYLTGNANTGKLFIRDDLDVLDQSYLHGTTGIGASPGESFGWESLIIGTGNTTRVPLFRARNGASANTFVSYANGDLDITGGFSANGATTLGAVDAGNVSIAGNATVGGTIRQGANPVQTVVNVTTASFALLSDISAGACASSGVVTATGAVANAHCEVLQDLAAWGPTFSLTYFCGSTSNNLAQVAICCNSSSTCTKPASRTYSLKFFP